MNNYYKLNYFVLIREAETNVSIWVFNGICNGSLKWTFLNILIHGVFQTLANFPAKGFFFCIIVLYLGGSFTFYPHQID